MKEIKWAVLGTGVIANQMAQALIKNGKNIYSVANRTHQKAVDFAQKYNIGKVYDNMNDVFTDPEVDVVYITTPHNTHLEFMKKAIENGKHILVEKSVCHIIFFKTSKVHGNKVHFSKCSGFQNFV